MIKQELKEYLQQQMAHTPKKLLGLASNSSGEPLFKRNLFFVLQKYACDFLQTKGEPRMVVMPGLRGTGKTTLMAQLFLALNEPGVTKIYLSVEEAIKRFDVTLWDIVEHYEALFGTSIEEFAHPLLFFFDEIHYDKQWAIFLKTLYDKSKNVMVFCTGSAALLLREQINADVARRVFFVDVYPVSFCEYLLFKYRKEPVAHLSDAMKETLFFSSSAEEVYAKLKTKAAAVDQYWLDIDKFALQNYIKLGAFPFALMINNEAIALEFIAQIINKVIYTDIPQFYKFTIETLNRIDKLLYLIADTLGVSATKLSMTLDMKPDTLRLVLQSLERAGLLLRVPPYGAHFKQIKKPTKYLFAASSLRFSYLAARDSIRVFETYRGALLEDVVGMYLNMLLSKFGDASLTYDVADGGADFIVSLGGKNIILEVGLGDKDCQQILKTAKALNSKYNLVVSSGGLELAREANTVKVPLQYFLLIC